MRDDPGGTPAAQPSDDSGPAPRSPAVPGSPPPAHMQRAVEASLGYLVVVARALTARGSRERPSDLVQSTVTLALGKIAEGHGPAEGEAKLKAWLRGIMVNLHRRAWKYKRPADGLSDDAVSSDTTSVASKLTRKEMAERMARARDRLSVRDRQVLDWKLEEKLTDRAIGERLGVSAVAGHKAYHRAVMRLEQAFLEVAAEDALRYTDEPSSSEGKVTSGVSPLQSGANAPDTT